MRVENGVLRGDTIGQPVPHLFPGLGSGAIEIGRGGPAAR